MGVVFEPRLSCDLGKCFLAGLYPTLFFPPVSLPYDLIKLPNLIWTDFTTS